MVLNSDHYPDIQVEEEPLVSGTAEQARTTPDQALLDAVDAVVRDVVAPEAGSRPRRGRRAVQRLQADMDAGRQRRLLYLGFPADEAAELSALHTRNFM